jgi:hypothetical protein
MAKRAEMTFQEKYRDRMENMGKDGITGIMRGGGEPIHNGVGGIGVASEGGDLEMWNQMSKNGNNVNNPSAGGNVGRGSDVNSKPGRKGVSANNISNISNKNNISKLLSVTHR